MTLSWIGLVVSLFALAFVVSTGVRAWNRERYELELETQYHKLGLGTDAIPRDGELHELHAHVRAGNGLIEWDCITVNQEPWSPNPLPEDDVFGTDHRLLQFKHLMREFGLAVQAEEKFSDVEPEYQRVVGAYAALLPQKDRPVLATIAYGEENRDPHDGPRLLSWNGMPPGVYHLQLMTADNDPMRGET